MFINALIVSGLIYIWYNIYNKLSFEKDYKVRSNYISFSHSVISTFIGSRYLSYKEPQMLSCLTLFSMSYFLWDMLFLIYNNKGRELYMYIYHHLVSIFILVLASREHPYEYIHIFYIGELSNFFNYIVYHLIKKKVSFTITNIIKIVQLFWFSYYRVYILLLMGINYTYVFDNLYFILILWSIYFMGIFWALGQFKNLKTVITRYVNNGLYLGISLVSSLCSKKH